MGFNSGFKGLNLAALLK